MFLLKSISHVLLAALGERVVAKAIFGAARWLASRSDTNIDDEIVKEWEDAYYAS